ncbi:hypothetical protein LTR56_025920 [Elasticomyces elasticus]|nr:hypothetical protein LTR56_025920 [Elasticomyces elasticus]KAK3618309.1 hypothetical protein LTR22_026419 [Elasticomyces elasticus]KAK4902990.1 hypothetical protein LTR49_026943 [Elasticomyces elasticus]KAK5737080.1 hypothetical protein LTS12_025998 [Elasticomyces elasticus]
MGRRSFTEKHSASNPFFGFLGPTKDAKTVSALQGHLVAMSGEFVGTFRFLFLAYCGHSMVVDQSPVNQAGPNGTNSATSVVHIAMSYGFAVLVTIWTMYRISGGLFNPAVTLGLIVTGNIPLVRGLLLWPVQILASMVAAGVVSAIIPGNIRTVQTTLTPTMSVAQGVFLEMFLTAIFIMNILMLAAEKSKDTFIAPIGIGLTLFICEIAGVFYTGASLNPARSFGPCVAGRNFQHYHWIYWIGPLLGAIVAAGYYHFVKFFNYEDANPGQDSSGGDLSGS